MTGPAIVGWLQYFFTGLEQVGFAQGFALGWSVTPPTEQFKGPTATFPPGQVMFETDWNNDNAASGLVPNFGTEVGGRFNFEVPAAMDLRYIVNEPTFYLWTVFDGYSANAVKLEMTVSVLNNVSPLALAAFAG